MRLIDADKLIKDIKELWDYKTVDGITAATVLKQTITDIENQPTVKAIPIEWIEKWINSKTKIWVNPKYADTVFTDVPVDYYENFTPYQVIAMLEDWEKENE